MPSRNVVVRGTNNKPVSSGMLANFFEDDDASPQGGELFVGYPVTTAAEGKRPIDAVYVSPTMGVVVFDIVEGADPGDVESQQDTAATRLEVRLKSHPDLVHRRQLMIPIHAVTFAPGVPVRLTAPDDNYPVVNSEQLGPFLLDLTWDEQDPDTYRRTVSALQSISGIRRSHTARHIEEHDSRGAKLQRLEGSIATLDGQQSRAVIETARDVQRIRGLAGSGKTVVLALKAAYLHAQHPDWRIGVTFQTRSLSDQFRRLINNFTIEQTGDEPDWSRVEVLPSWGAPGGGRRDGVYHRFCTDNDVAYRDFRQARSEFGSSDPLAGACRAALEEAGDQVRTSFDVLLVDEAQDLPPAFLRMCFEMLGGDKRLVYAYDELQTLNGTGLPPAEEIFGQREDGHPRVDFSRGDDGAQRDIILEKCYRNSRPVLVTAHALGFGIYRNPPRPDDTGLVQIFEQKALWEDIGYSVIDGQLADGERVSLARDADSSPRFLEDHSALEDLITFQSFTTPAEQAEWIAEQIAQNLRDELRPNDIIVINPDPLSTRNNVGSMRKALYGRGIQSHLAGVDTSADVFFKQDTDSVTFTGVYRAKGNEAGMVYVTNAHESLTNRLNLAQVRNRLFTAITRSKAWVRVTGVGPEMESLVEEFRRIKANDFALTFTYPTATQREKMQVVHRDVSKETQSRLRRYETGLGDLLSDLEAGEVYPEDLPPATLARLRALLGDDR